jgi:hypothetical protein
MPDITPATRSEILSELDSARHHFIATRDATEVSWICGSGSTRRPEVAAADTAR